MPTTDCPFEITPYALSEVYRSNTIENLNYTSQDFWSLKTRLVQLITEYFYDDFNDFVESSLAIMLIENWAFIADTLSFKIDQIANEVFIDSVAEIDNAFRLCNLVGFEPTPPIASRSLWSAEIQQPLSASIFIPTPYSIRLNTSDGLINIELFLADAQNNPLFDQDIEIPAGSTIVSSIVGLEGITNNQPYTSTGAGNQIVSLSVKSVIKDSIRVFVNNVEWEKVDYFTDSRPRREYRVDYDSDWRAYITFGNNKTGLIPSINSEIYITYRVGGGTIGNIIPNATYERSTLSVDIPPYGIPITFTNYTRGEFGYDGDDIEDVRRNLPAFISTQNRAVSGSDYKFLTDQFASPYQGQIGKSVAALRNYGCAANIIDLYVLARKNKDELEETTSELKSELYEYLNTKKMLSDFLCIKDGEILMVDLSIEVLVNRTKRKFEEEMKTRIERRLDLFFDLNNWEFGQDLRELDIIKTLVDLNDIKTVNIEFSTNDPDNGGDIVIAKYYQIIRPDIIDISFTYE
jgi:hypothetical protein